MNPVTADMRGAEHLPPFCSAEQTPLRRAPWRGAGGYAPKISNSAAVTKRSCLAGNSRLFTG